MPFLSQMPNQGLSYEDSLGPNKHCLARNRNIYIYIYIYMRRGRIYMRKDYIFFFPRSARAKRAHCEAELHYIKSSLHISEKYYIIKLSIT